MAPHHSDYMSQRLQASGYALCGCTLNVFVTIFALGIVIVFVFVIVFLLVRSRDSRLLISDHHSDEISQRLQVSMVAR